MDNNDIRCRIMEEELKTFWPQWYVEKRLGGGAFGDVFQIYKDNYGIRVWSALKVIQICNTIAEETVPIVGANPNYASHQNSAEELPKELLNEIQIMETLRGAPNIVSIDDFYFQRGSASSSLYVRMELLTSFQDVMTNRQRNNKQFTIAEVLKIGRDICTALMFCEERGIIHRDIKPANLFVDAFGSYKVGDFGASKRMETVHATHMMTGIGTISYMAPEIFAGRSYNNTVDIYALGMVLYQLLNSGRAPFLPKQRPYTTQDIDVANYKRLRGDELPSLVGMLVCDETIDTRLDNLIRKACKASSDERYKTAEEFYEALTAYKEQSRTPQYQVFNSGNQKKQSEKSKTTPKGTAYLIIAGVIVLLLLGGGFWLSRSTADFFQNTSSDASVLELTQEQEQAWYDSASQFIIDMDRVVQDGARQDQKDEPVYGPALSSWEKALPNIGEIQDITGKSIRFTEEGGVLIMNVKGSKQDAEVVFILETKDDGYFLTSITTKVD